METLNSSGRPPYLVPSVGAAAEVLQLLKEGRATLTEIAEAVALSKSTAYGIVKTLHRTRLLSYDQSTRLYALGIELLVLGDAAANQLDYLAIARPLLRELSAETGLTGIVAQRAGDQFIVVHKEEGSAVVRATMSIGLVLPPGAGAIGKTYAAFGLPPGGRTQPATPPAFTANTITDPARFAAELELIRERGYSTSYEEYRLGVNAVAAPVFDHRGEAVLMLSLIGFAGTMSPEAMAQYGERLEACCAEVSRALGRRRPAPGAESDGLDRGNTHR